MITEQPGGHAGAFPDTMRSCGIRCVVIRRRGGRYLLEYAVLFDEGSEATGVVFVARFPHRIRIEAKEDMEEVTCVAIDQAARQSQQMLRAGRQNSQGISLRRDMGQLVQLVTDGIVKEVVHVAPDETNRRNATQLFAIDLP